MEDAFMKTSEECVSYFQVDAERGLSQSQVESSRKKYGPNGECYSIISDKYTKEKVTIRLKDSLTSLQVITLSLQGRIQHPKSQI